MRDAVNMLAWEIVYPGSYLDALELLDLDDPDDALRHALMETEPQRDTCWAFDWYDWLDDHRLLAGRHEAIYRRAMRLAADAPKSTTRRLMKRSKVED